MTNVTFAIYPRDVYRRHVRVIKKLPHLATQEQGGAPIYQFVLTKLTYVLSLVFLRLHAFEVGLLVAANLFFPQPFHSESEGVADVHAMC